MTCRGGPEFFAYLIKLPEPLRLAGFSGHTRAVGLLEIDSPLGPSEIVIQAPDEEGPHAPQGDSTFPPLELTPGEG